MSTTDDEWTTAHDLALIYCGLACVDRDLSDDEVAAIEEPLTQWIPLSAGTTPGEVVQGAARALKQSRRNVRDAVQRVGQTLSTDERRETLQHLLRIGQADGVLLESERELIHHLATTWNLKQLSEAWGDSPSAVADRRPDDWSLLHELAFLFVQGGQGAENGLTSDLLGVMEVRLREWKLDGEDAPVRKILRRALEAFAEREEEPLFRDTVEGLNAALPSVQHLLVLDDLQTIAQVGAAPTDVQLRRLHALAEAWDITVRLEKV